MPKTTTSLFVYNSTDALT